MGYLLIKRITTILLMTFLSMVISPHYFWGEEIASNSSDFDKAKEFYKNGDYDKAIETFDRFIENNKNSKTLKNELTIAYYYKAKIYYTGEQLDNMKETLRKLFKQDSQYDFPAEKNSDFLKQANDIKKLVELEEKNKSTQIELERLKNKKKFPWLVVLGSAVVVGALVYLLTKKPKENTLTVTVGDGVDGTPVAGTHSYKKGLTVSYNFTLKTGYTGLSVKLDDQNVPASGTITMDASHTLSVTASKTFTLTVTRGTGINGTPETGTTTYTDGQTVTYNYTLQDGYTDLVVTIDGLTAPANGTIMMDRNHILAASADKTYNLQVAKGEGIIGIPDSGNVSYKDGYIVNYGYTLQTGYSNLVVLLDGIQVVPSGTIKMDQNHSLIATAGRTFTLTVIKGTGVDGSPNTGSYTYNEGDTVVYNFSLVSNYKNLTVTVDGTTVPVFGTITMNGNHTLTAAAEPLK
ncbi:MAG: hypothetical protein ACM3SY_06570 [Candidatus Omnitrophota bacterium]